MITAIVLIKTSVDRIPEIAESIAALESVSEVFSVTGTYDLIAMVRVKQHEDLAEVIPGRISKIPGVEGTDTHVAFRTYSQHDLEAAFAIGLDYGWEARRAASRVTGRAPRPKGVREARAQTADARGDAAGPAPLGRCASPAGTQRPSPCGTSTSRRRHQSLRRRRNARRARPGCPRRSSPGSR